MTLDQIDKAIEQRLAAHGSPVIEFNRLPRIVGCPDGSWWAFTKDLAPDELPSLFRAGGSQCLFTEDAAAWCKQFVRIKPSRFGVTEG